VTAIVVPPNIDSGEIVSRAWKRYNLSLGGGLNKVAGKVFRIGHVGHLNEVNYLFSHTSIIVTYCTDISQGKTFCWLFFR